MDFDYLKDREFWLKAAPVTIVAGCVISVLIINMRIAKLKRDVAAGKITQEQYDNIVGK